MSTNTNMNTNMHASTNTGMGVEQDERDATERDLRASEFEEPDEEFEARDEEFEDTQEPEESEGSFEPATWRDPAESEESADDLAEPYIGPGPVTEPEPSSLSAPAYEPAEPADLADPAASSASSPYSDRMREIQLAFIDDPRQAARDADGLLEDLLRGLTADLERRRSDLDGGMLTAAGAEDAAPPTEDLRVTVQQTRELVELLAQARERVQV